MNSNLLIFGASVLLLTSCSKELDSTIDKSIADEKAPLSFNVIDASTKAGSSGSLLPINSEIGVFVTKSDGSNYTSETPYNNIKYTGTGDTYADKWTVDPTSPVYLNFEKATAYAYYPRLSSNVSLTSIPLTNDDTDWMFSAPVEDLDIYNANASFILKHVKSIIRVTIDRLTESENGSISKVTIDGNGWARSASLNLKTGTFEDCVGIGDQLIKTNLGSLGETEQTFDHIIFPTGNTTDLLFSVTYDSELYTTTIYDVTFLPGKVYNYKLSVGKSEPLLINSVSVTDWDRTYSANLGYIPYKPILSWEEAKSIDGVYGMMTDGRAMVLEEAKKTNESLIGVAIVINSKAYQIAKTNATGYNGAYHVCWWKTGCRDVRELNNYPTVDGTDGHNYGNFDEGRPNQLSKVYSTWVAGALSDFNGKENTAFILAAQGNGTLDYTIGKAVMDFRGNSSKNEGHDDWFVPSCGELAFMYLKKTELESLLRKVYGDTFSGTYWCSSELSSDRAYALDFSNRAVTNASKSVICGLRLVREL